MHYTQKCPIVGTPRTSGTETLNSHKIMNLIAINMIFSESESYFIGLSEYVTVVCKYVAFEF